MNRRYEIYYRLAEALYSAGIDMSVPTHDSIREAVEAMEHNDTDPALIGFAIGLYYLIFLDTDLLIQEFYRPKADQ